MLFMHLTEKQKVIIETIQQFKKENGRPPYKKELAEALPWKPTIHALAFSVRYLIKRLCLTKIPVPEGVKIARINFQESQCQLIDVTPYGEHCYANMGFAYEEKATEEQAKKFIFSQEESELLDLIDDVEISQGSKKEETLNNNNKKWKSKKKKLKRRQNQSRRQEV